MKCTKHTTKTIKGQVGIYFRTQDLICKIIKWHAENTQLFHDLYEDEEAEYSGLFFSYRSCSDFHMEVFWIECRLSGLNQKSLWCIEKHVLGDKLKISWFSHLEYLVDILAHVNSLKKKLKRENISVILTFGSRLSTWELESGEKKHGYLSKVSSFVNILKNSILTPVGQLQSIWPNLKKHFSNYFSNLNLHTLSWLSWCAWRVWRICRISFCILLQKKAYMEFQN